MSGLIVASRDTEYPTARWGYNSGVMTNTVCFISSGSMMYAVTRSMNGLPAAREIAKPSIPNPMLEYEYRSPGAARKDVIGIDARILSCHIAIGPAAAPGNSGSRIRPAV